MVFGSAETAVGGASRQYQRFELVEKEDEARALLVQLKAGAKFEDLAQKNSKDNGSAENGGDLDSDKTDFKVGS